MERKSNLIIAIASIFLVGCATGKSLIHETTTIAERINYSEDGIISSIDKGIKDEVRFRASSTQSLYAKGKANVQMGYKADADGSFNITSNGEQEGEVTFSPEALNAFMQHVIGLLMKGFMSGVPTP